ncbi:MAG: stage III sporulation protein AG [Clostridium sp.]|uniref:stage III sporulation protein AG n=1 Tax=Clostridium sp. TaxID=1506 RepID=UPI003EE591F5
MDFKKVKEEFNKMMKDKKFSNLLIIIIVLGIVVLVGSIFFDRKESGKSEGNGALNVSVNEAESKETVLSKDEYEKEQKEQLISILEKMNGVGKVDVYMTFESGEVKVPAYDNNTQTTVTNEEDSSGGKRVNEQKNDGSTVVMSSGDKGNTPFITKIYKPKVQGIMITAEGAENSKTKYNIEKAVSDLYNLSFDKVNVYPMGDKHIN